MNQVTPQLLTAVFEKLVDSLAVEPDAAALSFFVKSFADSQSPLSLRPPHPPSLSPSSDSPFPLSSPLAVRVVGLSYLPADIRTKLDEGCESQLVDISDRRKLRAERSRGWDQEEKEQAWELEREETAGLNEFSKLFALLEPENGGQGHRLQYVCSSVKDLGSAPNEEWEEEE